MNCSTYSEILSYCKRFRTEPKEMHEMQTGTFTIIFVNGTQKEVELNYFEVIKFCQFLANYFNTRITFKHLTNEQRKQKPKIYSLPTIYKIHTKLNF
jgi:hypothetical protein